MSASLIGRLGSSAFRPSTTTVSMSLAGSCVSSESDSQLRQLNLFPRRICGIHAGLFRPINGFRADAGDFSL